MLCSLVRLWWELGRRDLESGPFLEGLVFLVAVGKFGFDVAQLLLGRLQVILSGAELYLRNLIVAHSLIQPLLGVAQLSCV